MSSGQPEAANTLKTSQKHAIQPAIKTKTPEIKASEVR